MNPDQVSRALISIKDEFREILDSRSCERVLMKARDHVQQTSRLYEQFLNRTDTRNAIVSEGWGFSISRDAPLRFRETKISGHQFWVDLTCELRWQKVRKNEYTIQNGIWHSDCGLLIHESCFEKSGTPLEFSRK